MKSPIIFLVLSLTMVLTIIADPIMLRQATYPDVVVFDFSDKSSQSVLLGESVGDVESNIVIWNNKIIFNLGDYRSGVHYIFDMSNLMTESTGYRYLIGPNLYSYTILAGGGFFVTSAFTISDFQKSKLRDRTRKHLKMNYPYFGYVDDGVKNIFAWSELTQNQNGKSIKYQSSNLLQPIILTIEETVWVTLNQINPPWAEGVPGPGIGGTIDVEFSRQTKEIDILNGYVDLAKRNLYKENNRLKTIRVDSEKPKFSITFNFEDLVKFHEIPLPMATEKVRITIVDVYKGTKYDDTCVTKLFIPQKELRPRAEYEAAIEKALRLSGYLK